MTKRKKNEEISEWKAPTIFSVEQDIKNSEDSLKGLNEELKLALKNDFGIVSNFSYTDESLCGNYTRIGRRVGIRIPKAIRTNKEVLKGLSNLFTRFYGEKPILIEKSYFADHSDTLFWFDKPIILKSGSKEEKEWLKKNRPEKDEE